MGWMDWMAQGSHAARSVASVSAGLVIAVLGVATSMDASAQLGQALGTGISNSKHNLGTGGPGTVKQSAGGSTEVCVFCHTPHGSSETATAPLWNRAASTATFTTYNSTRLQGGDSAADGAAYTPGSVSLACLSCHDGVTAINSVINAPGSGGWAGGGAVTSFGVMANGGVMPAGRIATIGTDLNNDHPIGVKYAGGATTANATTTFTTNGFAAWTSQSINGATAFWVDTEYTAGARTGNGTRQKTDMWLYTRDTAGLTDTAFVECASCHDPHAVENGTFLRIKNDYSSVCLACHIK